MATPTIRGTTSHTANRPIRGRDFTARNRRRGGGGAAISAVDSRTAAVAIALIGRTVR